MGRIRIPAKLWVNFLGSDGIQGSWAAVATELLLAEIQQQLRSANCNWPKLVTAHSQMHRHELLHLDAAARDIRVPMSEPETGHISR